MMYICVHSKVLFIYLNIEENTESVEIVENESYLHFVLPYQIAQELILSLKGGGDPVFEIWNHQRINFRYMLKIATKKGGYC